MISGRIAANPPISARVVFLPIIKTIKTPREISVVILNISWRGTFQNFCLRLTLYSLCGMKSKKKCEKKAKNNPNAGFWVFVAIAAPTKIWQAAIIDFKRKYDKLKIIVA